MNADTFGIWIRKRRKSLDLTQEALAQRVGCSLSAIRKIENDERRPSRQIAEILALHLQVPPEEQTLFLKIARGEASISQLGSAPAAQEAWAAVPETVLPASNIPASTSAFIGRQQECESLASMLTDPHQRLITILGPGGIGKTRLAVEAANAQLSTFNHHVYFIQLAGFNTVDSILPAIATTLNIPSTNVEELKTRLVAHLRGKKVLLVIDNFEHLVEGAPLFSELLQKTPDMKLLFTSRERLNLQGEWTFELGGLSVPPGADEGKAAYSALQLFESHAHRIRPGLQLAGSERAAAIRICQRVDGMPLAIELAAAWVNVLSCEEIACEIELGFDFLSSTLRDIPERHRSLRAAFEHSWKRLNVTEQNVLSRLTVFQSGFSHEAASVVAGAERHVLSSLVSKSLLRRSPAGRFDLHEVIRQYALDYLKEDAGLRDRHARYYLSLLKERDPAPGESNSDMDWLRETSAEYGNLRLAWEHAIQQKMYPEIDGVLDTAWLIYAIHGWVKEGIEQTLALAQSLRGSARTRSENLLLARAILSANAFLARTGEFAKAARLFEESTAILRAAEHIEYLSNNLIVYGKLAGFMGDFALAHKLLDEGLELAGKGKNVWLFGLGYVNQGYILGQEGKYERACERIQSGLAVNRESKNSHAIAFSLNHLSFILLQLGRLDEADAALQESLSLSTEIRDRWGMATAYGRLGMLARLRSDLNLAKSMLEKSLSLFGDLGARADLAWTLTQLGKAAIAAEAWPEAEQALARSIELSLACPALPQTIEALPELADCFAHQGEAGKALQLALLARDHPVALPETNDRAATIIAGLQQSMSPGDIADARARVESQSLEPLIREILAGTLS